MCGSYSSITGVGLSSHLCLQITNQDRHRAISVSCDSFPSQTAQRNASLRPHQSCRDPPESACRLALRLLPLPATLHQTKTPAVSFW